MTIKRPITVIALALISSLVSSPQASEIVEVLPLTDSILMVHFDDGSVIHHKKGQPRSQEEVLVQPLDTAAASRAESYQVSSSQDPAYGQGKNPLMVGRKSKGTDFAWFADKWENNRAVNSRPDHTKEHWLYLHLPQALKRGSNYVLRTGNLASNGGEWKILFDERSARSEAIHVNILGYVPGAPAKFGYVFHWMGDKGGLDLKAYAGRPFYLLDQVSGQVSFTGKLTFRAPATQAETFHKSDSPPEGNFLNAEVYDCDFSSFSTAGRYVLAVEGIGCSLPFRIDQDIYREAFRTTARGLYHNRSGIELKAPYTDYARPAPHNPKLTPGFAGKLMYTTVRFTEWGSEGGDPEKLKAAFKGPLESCGWYQDAGDWDSYYSHLRPAQELLLVYLMASKNFADGELRIPESGNGVPDILDEAAWLPRFLYRLRQELIAKKYGSGGVGLRVAGDGFGGDEKKLPDGRNVGQGSWEDVDRIWAASGEDPWSTYRYAGTAAQLAEALARSGVKDPQGVDWAKEAVESFAWARKNTRPGDEAVQEPKLRQPRAYAAAALFRLTGDPAYEKQFAQDTEFVQDTTLLWDEDRYGPFVYGLPGGKAQASPALLSRIRAAILSTADEAAVATPQKRALRWGGNFFMPMLVGQQTTPWLLEGALGYFLAKSSEPARASKYLASLYSTCDYFLGGNSLNMTWVTGLGPRYPRHVFHMDAWYNGKDSFHPGLIPYGPWRKSKDLGQGPWDSDWPNQTLYPGIDLWPGNERWFDNRCSPLNAEFTIHQNTGPAAALFGFLCAPGPSAP